MAVFIPDRLTIFREKTAICGCEQVPENTCYSWRAAVSLLEVVPQSFFQVRTLAAATHRVLGTQTG